MFALDVCFPTVLFESLLCLVRFVSFRFFFILLFRSLCFLFNLFFLFLYFVFSRLPDRTHLLCTVDGWTPEGWMLRPLNSFGEPEGDPSCEDSKNVSVLPDEDSEFAFGTVRSYTLANEGVELAPPNPKPNRKRKHVSKPVSNGEEVAKRKHTAQSPKTKATSKSSTPTRTPTRKQDKTKTKSTKRKRKPKAKTKSTKRTPKSDKKYRTPSKKKQRQAKRKRKRKALDIATSSSAPNTEDEPTVFTVKSVLASFAMRKGTVRICSHVNITCEHHM